MPHQENLDAIIKALVDHVFVCKGVKLTGAQHKVLWHLLQDASLSYPQMVDLPYPGGRTYKSSSLKTAKSELFKILIQVFKKTLTKDNLRAEIMAWYEHQQGPNATRLFGRERDIATLKDEISQRHSSFFCIYGPPQIGKTEVARRLHEYFRQTVRSKESFDHVVWCSASTDELETIDKLHEFILKEVYSSKKETYQNSARSLASFLRKQRCLLILDEGDSLYDPEYSDGRFQEKSACYERWLKILLGGPLIHSSLLWVSCIPPRIDSAGLSRREYPLDPINSNESEKIIHIDFNNRLDKETTNKLANFCGHNPGILKAVSIHIKRKHFNRVDSFMSQPLNLREDFFRWYEVTESLTHKEKYILPWILLYPFKSVDQESILFRKSSDSRRNALSALFSRGFLNMEDSDKFSLKSPFLEHVIASWLVSYLSYAFQERNLDIISSFPIIPTKCPLWKEKWHKDFVLRPLADSITLRFEQEDIWSSKDKSKKINELLEKLKADGFNRGYTAGNILNIASSIDIPLNMLNVEELQIKNVDLSIANLSNLNFSKCHFYHVKVPVILYGRISTSLSPSGKVFAVGDSKGNIFCWRFNKDHFNLSCFCNMADQHSKRQVSNITFGDDNTLVFSIENQVYRWWINSDPLPEPLFTVSETNQITCLTCEGEEDVAAGLDTGSILLWREIESRYIMLEEHRHSVSALGFGPDTSCLFSIGSADRVIEWTNLHEENEHEIPWIRSAASESTSYIYISACYCQHGLITARIATDRSAVQLINNSERPSIDYNIERDVVCFSHHGSYIAIVDQNRTHVISVAYGTSHQSVPHERSPDDVVVSDDGRWLLTVTNKCQERNKTAEVSLWDLSDGKLWWKSYSLTQAPQFSKEVSGKIDNSQGLSKIEEQYLGSIGVDIT